MLIIIIIIIIIIQDKEEESHKEQEQDEEEEELVPAMASVLGTATARQVITERITYALMRVIKQTTTAHVRGTISTTVPTVKYEVYDI